MNEIRQVPKPETEEILDANGVASLLKVNYAWVIKHSHPSRHWRIPSFKIGKFRKYRRSAVLEAIIELEKSHQRSA